MAVFTFSSVYVNAVVVSVAMFFVVGFGVYILFYHFVGCFEQQKALLKNEQLKEK
jgi:hypothetical protein